MKLNTYNPQVNLNTLSGQVRAPRDPNAYGANTEGFDALGKGLQAQQNIMVKMQEDQDATNAMAASLEFDQKMDDALWGDNGFMHQQQQGALGVTKKIAEFADKTKKELAQKYPFQLQKGQQAFENLISKSGQQRIELGQRYEFQETEKYKTTIMASKAKTAINFMSMNYKNNQLIAQGFKDTEDIIKARFYGQGDAVVQSALTEFRGEASAALVNAAIANGDETRAEQLGYLLRNDISPDARNKNTQWVLGKKKENWKATTADSIIKAHPNDVSGAVAAVDALGGNTVNRSNIVASATSQLGIKYNLGGDGSRESGTDCGQVINIAYNNAGINWNSRYVPNMEQEAKDKGWWRGPEYISQVKPGDAIIVGVRQEDGSIDPEAHVVMVGEDGKIIQAGTSRGEVYESSQPITEMFPSITGVIAVGGDTGVTIDAADIKELKDSVISGFSKAKTLENIQKQQDISAFEDNAFQLYRSGERDINVFNSMALEAAGGDWDKYKAFQTQIASLFPNHGSRTKSDVDTMVSLQAKIKQASIEQVGAVRDLVKSSRQLLSDNDYIKLNGDLDDKISGKNDEVGNRADTLWMAEVSDKKEQANILFRLDNNNVRGIDRYKQAMEMSKEKGVSNYMSTSNSVLNQLNKDFDPALVALTTYGFNLGFVDGGQTYTKKDDYNEVNRFLSKLGSEYGTVPYTEDAVDWLMANAKPINPETVKKARSMIEAQKRDDGQ